MEQYSFAEQSLCTVQYFPELVGVGITVMLGIGVGVTVLNAIPKSIILFAFRPKPSRTIGFVVVAEYPVGTVSFTI